MSYDLMVFDPDAAPRAPDAFLEWYDEQTQWGEGHGYDDPSVSSPPLRAWFTEIIQQFPAMNGPLARPASSEKSSSAITDYSVGSHVIYASFAWSLAESAYDAVLELSRKHQLGFFDVSDTGEVWLPVNGDYALVFHAS